jgi:heme o synthase
VVTQPIVAPLDVSLIQHNRVIEPALSDYWALTKPEVNFLIVITTFAGFYLGRAGPWRDFPFLLMIHTLVGTLLVASGTGTLNQYIERRFDARMRRTSRRPLAAGRLKPSAVLWFGVALSLMGSVYLAVAVNLLASLLAVLTLLSYLFLYTPLKRRTPLCTLVGAFPGAMPPLIGWAGASGKLSFEAWVLYALLFLWQFPHFMAIAWMYRDDYDRAGYLVLPPDGPARDRFVNFQTILPLLGLVALSPLLALGRQPSLLCGMGVFLLSLGFFGCGAQFVLRRTNSAARRLLAASVISLPSIFIWMVLLTSRRASWHSGFENQVAYHGEKSNAVTGLSQVPCQPRGLDCLSAQHLDEYLLSAVRISRMRNDKSSQSSWRSKTHVETKGV